MTPNAALSANWSPLEHVPSDEVLSKLVDVAERRWTSERFDADVDARVLMDRLDTLDTPLDELRAASVIEAANGLAYSLGRKRPVVLMPNGIWPTVRFNVVLERPGEIMGHGSTAVREAMQAGARTVDALLAIRQVRDGLDHESRRFCYRTWLAGAGRRKPETEGTRRAMAALLLELLTRP